MSAVNKSAQVILSGYDGSKIKESFKMLLKYSEKNNLVVESQETNVKSKAKSKLWGCEKNNIDQRILYLNGTIDNLRKILDAEIKDGIYLQLLLK